MSVVVNSETLPDDLELPNDALETTLGIAPSDLQFCFDRKVFLNNNFDEEGFILDRLNMGITVETLRDSLLQYFNILKNSLVELINQDYADFVNLSTNLFGLNKTIDSLVSPLERIKASVSAVRDDIRKTKKEFEDNLDERMKLREKKELIHSLLTVSACTTRLERWLAPPIPQSVTETCDELAPLPNDDLSMNNWMREACRLPLANRDSSSFREYPLQEEQQIDRIALEYTKLQYFTRKCLDHPFIADLKPRIQMITGSLQEQLESRLCSSLNLCHELQAGASAKSSGGKPPQSNLTSIRKASSLLRQILSTYLSIDRLSDAMNLYRKHFLQPKLSSIFAPCAELSSSRTDPLSARSILEAMFKSSLELLASECSLFQQYVFKHAHRSYEPLGDFDALVNGFFPEMTEILFQQLPEIFSAGNPDKFFELYTAGLNFLDEVERKADSHEQVRRLRNHPSYSDFLNKWSLSVYFQLRFQESSNKISECLRSLHIESNSPSHGCCLEVTEVILSQIEWCWSDKIFLNPLRHRFWKLTLQLINVFWNVLGNVRLPLNTANLDAIVGIHPLLYVIDTHHFIRWIDNGNLAAPVLTCIPNSAEQREGNNDESESTIPLWLRDCVEDSRSRIIVSLSGLKLKIVNSFQESIQSLVHQVQDLPRQYRRTNRAWPTAPSAFVLKINNRLKTLDSEIGELLLKPNVANFSELDAELRILFGELILRTTTLFQTEIVELLASVKKVEDSLRRLRVARSGGVSTSAGKSDDDKIRHQLQLDMSAFLENLKNLPLLSWDLLQKNSLLLEDLLTQT